MKNIIKIIDLLCLISNGEEVPKKIKYEDDIWVWTGDDYRKDISDTFLFTTQHYIWFTDFINNEVEILDDEEDNLTTLKFGDEVVLTRTNCDDIQGFIISAKGIEPIEDKDIPLIPDDELWIINKRKGISNDCKYGIDGDTALNHNFKVLREKINQVVEEFNEYRKENE